VPIELSWETNLAGTPRQELGMVSLELLTSECGYRPPGTVPLGTVPLPPNDPRGSRLVPYYGLIAYLCQIAERISSHPFDPLLACFSRCPLFTATTLAT